MPGLKSLLASYDVAFLRDVAELWGIEAHTVEKRALLAELARGMNSEASFREVIGAANSPVAQALSHFSASGGVMPWQTFEHTFGTLRPMGPARRKREKPHRFPVNTSERLWYLGLVGRGTLRHHDELSEVAFVADELVPFLPKPKPNLASPAASRLPVWSASRVTPDPARGYQILNDLCTLFAALRTNQYERLPELSGKSPIYWQRQKYLAEALRLLDAQFQPNDTARVLLEKPRAEAFGWLVMNWMHSPAFDELLLVPQLRCEAAHQHTALAPRQALIDHLAALPADAWFRLEDLVDDIFERLPNFLRSGTDFNRWIISSTSPEHQLLHGFDHWRDVEGQYILFFVQHILTDFGLVRTGSLSDDSTADFFQLTPWFFQMLIQNQTPDLPAENQPVIISRDGKLEMSPLVPRIARYQLSRFTDWLSIQPAQFVYQLTPSSLQAAAEQGLEVKHLRALLRKFGKSGIPPVLQKALLRWERHGLEARIEPLLVLRLSEPALLERLRETKIANCLGEALGPTAVLVKPGCEKRVRAALHDLGILSNLPGGDQ